MKDGLCQLSEHLGSSKSWPLVLSILQRGLSGGKRTRRQWSGYCIFLKRFEYVQYSMVSWRRGFAFVLKSTRLMGLVVDRHVRNFSECFTTSESANHPFMSLPPRSHRSVVYHTTAVERGQWRDILHRGANHILSVAEKYSRIPHIFWGPLGPRKIRGFRE